MAEVTTGQKSCLMALDQLTYPDGEMCVGFAPLVAVTGFGRQIVRRHVRALARKGLAEYYRGLWSESGEPAGAGYCITTEGRECVTPSTKETD